MFVPCRSCDACKISKANEKTALLYQELKKYPYIYFVTLTYDNEHLPVVLNGDNRIIRGCVNEFGEILDYLDAPLFVDGGRLPVGSNINDCIGVLYYKDIQNFFKRLRVYYEREYKRKFQLQIFGVGEYGSKSKRPHFHFLLYGWSNEYQILCSSIVENWKMCDWCKLDIDECIKLADASSSSYIASYVNCGSCGDGLPQQKRFQQKTFRSKDLNFGIDAKIYDSLAEVLRIGFIGNELFERVPRPFEVLRDEKINAVSFSIISTKFFRSFVAKPKNCSDASFVTFRRCANEVYRKYYVTNRRDLVNSTDYSFILAYRRYLDVTGFVNNPMVFNVYLLAVWNLFNYFKSLQLKYQMSAYEKKKELDYHVNLIDSYIDKPFKRFLQIRKIGRPEKIWHLVYHPVSDKLRVELNMYESKYKKRLLTKHIKNEINF